MSVIKRRVGVDLGTTNTVLAEGGGVLSGKDGPQAGPFLPSVVAFLPNGSKTIGAPARRRLPIDPKNTIASAKRLIGRKWTSPETKRFRETYPYELEEGEGGDSVFKTRAGQVSPVTVGQLVLEGKWGQVELSARNVSAILTVPSKFGELERTATRLAAERAGLAEVRILDEPVATAWAYLRKPTPDVHHAVVYDFGGGTFDFAVLDCSADPFRVVAHGGDLYLGGDDIDRALADHVSDVVLERDRWDLKSNLVVRARLVDECEKAKIRWAYTGKLELELSRVDPAAPFSSKTLSLDAGVVEGLLGEFVQRSFIICDEVLHKAKIKAKDVNQVLLAGGTTQFSVVRDAVEQYFGQDPRCDYDPMEVIAIGASVLAAQRGD